MLIKRKDLELVEKALARGVDRRCLQAHEIKLAAWQLAKKLLATPDPVDVVPVQDYPFPLRHEHDEEWELR